MEKTKEIIAASWERCQKYGVEYTGQIPQKIEKTKNTFLEKYGVDSIFKSNKIRE